MTRRQDILDQAEHIEFLPPSALELLAAIQDPEADVPSIARIVEHEPAIAANVLKLANSASSSPCQRINSINQALVRLGLRQTTQVVLEATFAPHLGKPVRGYDLPPSALWQYSAAVAIATQVLPRLIGEAPTNEAFTAGLLNDVGKIVMGHFIQIDLDGVYALVSEQGMTFDQAERACLGTDHAEVGAVMLESWGLGHELVQAVRWHHDPEQSDPDTRGVTNLVHYCAHLMTTAGIGGGNDGMHYTACDQSMPDCHLSHALSEKVLCQTMIELDDLIDLSNDMKGRSVA